MDTKAGVVETVNSVYESNDADAEAPKSEVDFLEDY